VGGYILKDSEVLEYLVYLMENDMKKLRLILIFLNRKMHEQESREAARDLIEKVRHDRPYSKSRTVQRIVEAGDENVFNMGQLEL
jgi:hypothetical protein